MGENAIAFTCTILIRLLTVNSQQSTVNSQQSPRVIMQFRCA
ncbi:MULTISPECIES: hypothetical protein [unclassified Calothrix]|nr:MULTISPECIES: hypothetical protein [unclassified Calothrix]